MLDEIERKVLNHCKKLPCFSCLVKPICFKGVGEKPGSVCKAYQDWHFKKNNFRNAWGKIHNPVEKITYLFEIAIKELKKEEEK
jgi:hypothetical protein